MDFSPNELNNMFDMYIRNKKAYLANLTTIINGRFISSRVKPITKQVLLNKNEEVILT